MQFPLATLATRRVASLHDARVARAERKRLCAELDTYRTHAERAELDAILSRHSAEELDTLAALTGRRSWAA